MVIASPSLGCAPADTVQGAVSLNHLGLPQALLCRAVPCPELVCPRYCLSWLNFMRFLSYHSFSLSPWVAALPLTILALPLICCHPQTWWKGILSPPLGIPADIKQVMSQERSIQYSTSYWPPERVQPFNPGLWVLSSSSLPMWLSIYLAHNALIWIQESRWCQKHCISQGK